MAAASEPTPQDTEYECPVCLQTCIHPVRLPCSHIFCFLCIKGVANQSKRCAMCRKEIPADFLENPDLVEKDIDTPKDRSEEYHWFYEGRGRNGWWRFDQRSNDDIEEAYRNRDSRIRLTIAGNLYDIDLIEFLQIRVDKPFLKRRIKWDTRETLAKGTAGLMETQLTNQPVASTSQDPVPQPTTKRPTRKGTKRKYGQ